MPPQLSRLVARIGSVRLTVVLLVTLAGGVLLQDDVLPASIIVAPSLVALGVNVACAAASNRRIRTSTPLFGLHVALLILLAVLLMAWLTYFDGKASVSVGGVFGGEAFGVRSGALRWHEPNLPRFSNDRFQQVVPDGERFAVAYNEISWTDDRGNRRAAVIEDGKSAVVAGYRVHITPSRGRNLWFEWVGDDGSREIGSVQLPDTVSSGSPKAPRAGRNEVPKGFSEAAEWTLPNGEVAWAMFGSGQEGSEDVEKAVDANRNAIVIHVGGRRWNLSPGEEVVLPSGRLIYVRPGVWVGYRIVRDVMSTWILAACFLVVLFMAWFYWDTYSRREGRQRD